MPRLKPRPNQLLKQLSHKNQMLIRNYKLKLIPRLRPNLTRKRLKLQHNSPKSRRKHRATKRAKKLKKLPKPKKKNQRQRIQGLTKTNPMNPMMITTTKNMTIMTTMTTTTSTNTNQMIPVPTTQEVATTSEN